MVPVDEKQAARSTRTSCRRHAAAQLHPKAPPTHLCGEVRINWNNQTSGGRLKI